MFYWKLVTDNWKLPANTKNGSNTMIKNVNSTPLSMIKQEGGGFIRAVVVRELDQSGAYVLKAEGSGREFAVRTDANSGLSVGQNVLVNPSEGKIVLIPENSTPQQSQLLKQLSSDIFNKSEQPTQETGDAKDTTAKTNQKMVDFAVSLDKIFADGLYKINSAKNMELTDKVLRELSGEAKDYVAVRLSSSGGQQVVSAVAHENLQKVIEEMHANFSSSLLRSLPAEFFERLFAERGELNTDTLNKLDLLLQTRNLSIDSTSHLQIEKLNQLIRLMLDNPQLIEKLIDRIPASGAQDIARQFDFLGKMSVVFLPDMAGQGGAVTPETFFLTEDKLSTDSLNRGGLIENLCKSAFSAAPAKLLEILEKMDSLGQKTVNAQLPANEARQIVNEFLSKFPTIAYKELEVVHDSKQFSPKILDREIQPRPEPSKQAAAAAMIKNALSELAETAVKTLLEGSAKQTATVISEKTGALREIINQIQAAEKPVSNEIKPDTLSKSNHTVTVENSIQNKTNPDVLIKTDVLIKIVDNLEKTVASLSGVHSRVELDSGQKANLLTLVQTAVSLGHEMLRSETQTYPVSENFYNRLFSMPQLQNSTAENENAVFSRIAAAQESIQQLIRDAGGFDDKTSSKEILNFGHKMWVETEKLRAGFQEAFSSLDLQNRLSSLESTNAQNSLVTHRSIESLRLDLMMDVSKALQGVFSSIKELSSVVSQLPESLRTLPEIEKVLRAIAETLEQQTRQSGEALTEKLKAALRELTHLQAENSKMIQLAQQQNAAGKPASAQTAEFQQQNAQSLLGDAIKSAIQTAARGLESLQLLSAQTQAAAGDTQQQIVALPVKIGQEWTEVHVKFLRDRSGKKKNSDSGHVSIYLNVAPSTLGEVGAHLDFHPPANLKLSFQFERTTTKKWFMNQSANIREALADAGLPGAVLEFRSKRAQSTDGESAKERRKSGKVDFEA